MHHIKFTTRGEAKQVIFEYIEVFYNRVRMHSTNDYLSPIEYEKTHGLFQGMSQQALVGFIPAHPCSVITKSQESFEILK
jgi:hypothetical protein